MKKKLFILLISGLIVLTGGYSQDSIRTRNDKPGTPQSLRKVNITPASQVHVVNTNVAPGQSINHGATESNNVNNKQEQTIVSEPNTVNSTVPNSVNVTDPKTGKVNRGSPASTGPADTLSNGINNRKTNVTNPIRK